MTREAILAEIRKLPPDQRFELMGQLWDEFEPGDFPMPDWHKEELDRRLNDPTEVANIPWEKVRDELWPPKK